MDVTNFLDSKDYNGIGEPNPWGSIPVPLDPYEFLLNRELLSDSELSCYIKLLCHQWLVVDVPSHPESYGAFGSPETVSKVITKFFVIEEGGRAYCPWLRDERLRVAKEVLRKRKAAKKYRQDQGSSVYLMAGPMCPSESRAAKIGISIHPQFRVQQVRCPVTNSEPTLLASTALTVEARDIESSLHKKLSQHRIEGEWFKYKPAMKAFKTLGSEVDVFWLGGLA